MNLEIDESSRKQKIVAAGREVLRGLHAASHHDADPEFAQYLARWETGQHLDRQEAGRCFELLLSTRTTEEQIGEFLVHAQPDWLNVEELTGFAHVLRKHAPKIKSHFTGAQALGDTCGTGGDTIPTFNVSTTVMFVLAAAGIPIAKHGNRAFTSRCGSADVLQYLGVRIDLPPAAIETCLDKIHMAFMFAPVFHGATGRVQRIRKILADEMPKALQYKTVFNVLGPLSNPAQTPWQMLGVYDSRLLMKIACALQSMNVKRAVVVHGHAQEGDDSRGLDEISTLGPTDVVEVREEEILPYRIEPEAFFELGTHRRPRAAEVAGGDIEQNAKILEGILRGEILGPKRDLVIANAAVGLYLADHATFSRPLKECALDCARKAREILESGAAYKKLEELRDTTREMARHLPS